MFFILVSHFRHKRTIHDSSRDFVQIIENVPFAVKSIICPDRNVRILNYDIIAEEDLKCEIIKHFLSKDYVLLITSFSVKRQNLPKWKIGGEITNFHPGWYFFFKFSKFGQLFYIPSSLTNFEAFPQHTFKIWP